MNNIGILAYGSLIDCPGQEIQAVIANRVEGVKTPFKVEFARRSLRRDGAPTLVPVEEGGVCVKAVILVLEEHISEKEAKNMLYRRKLTRSAPTENTNIHATLAQILSAYNERRTSAAQGSYFTPRLGRLSLSPIERHKGWLNWP